MGAERNICRINATPMHSFTTTAFIKFHHQQWYKNYSVRTQKSTIHKDNHTSQSLSRIFLNIKVYSLIFFLLVINMNKRGHMTGMGNLSERLLTRHRFKKVQHTSGIYKIIGLYVIYTEFKQYFPTCCHFQHVYLQSESM